jgi:hypothetical protein
MGSVELLLGSIDHDKIESPRRHNLEDLWLASLPIDSITASVVSVTFRKAVDGR